LVGGVVVTLGLAAGAAGLTYLFRTLEQLPRAELVATGVLAEAAPPGEPTNFLIVGVDSAEKLAAGDPVRRGRDGLNERSDTVMVVRINPESRKVALLSLPRDLWVPIAGTGTEQRINTAIQLGGPELLIRTIDEYLGIPIQHFVQVDFAGFRDLVDTIGGVEITVPHPARDQRSGLNIPKGRVTLDTDQALAYVRSRAYEERIDGEWVTDPTGDIGRIKRQQKFITAALRAAIDQGGRNLARLDQLLNVGLDSIVVDDALTADDILRLGNQFRSLEPADLDTRVVPTIDGTVGAAQILRLDEDKAESVLAPFRGASRDEISPQSVRLRVLNGSGQPGEGTSANEELTAVGFASSGAGDAERFDYDRTTVQYSPGQRDAAELVARWLVAGAELEPVSDAKGIVVIIGRDWLGVRSQPAPAEDSDGSTFAGSAGTG
jgi:LCP family protein required for cell wall assembly